MPVLIREIHVKVNVEEGRQQSMRRPSADQRENRDALVSECVEKAVEIMKKEKLR